MVKTFCVNLVTKKLHEQVKILLQDLDIKDVKFSNSTPHKLGGKYGCYESHLNIWKEFYTDFPDEKYCLIFEEDVTINDDHIQMSYYKDIISQAETFINNNYHDIDFIFLKNNSFELDSEINNELFTKGFGFTMHAYIITRQYIENIIKKNNNNFPLPINFHIDYEITINYNSILYSEKIYYLKPTGFLQLDNTVNQTSNGYTSIIHFSEKYVMTAPATKFILFFNYINKYLNINSYYYKYIIIVLSNLY
jgi:GR25 family glycosyltransferase involved in LPS biosynthesis